MKIICGSCKAIIDTEKHDFCPKCGSNFNYSEGLKGGTRTEDYKEYERNRQESNVRMAQAEAERARDAHEAEHRANAMEAERAAREQRNIQETRRRHQAHSEKQTGKKNTGCGCFVTAVIAISVIGGFLSDVDSEGELFDKIADEFNAYVEEETADFTAPIYVEDEPVDYDYYYEQTSPPEYSYEMETLEWGEIGYGDGYTIRGNVMIIGDNELTAPEGYKYIEFGFTAENTSDSDVYINMGNFRCFADSVECYPADGGQSGYEPYLLEENAIVSINLKYEVPLGTIMYEVVYNDEFCFYVFNDDYNDEIAAMTEYAEAGFGEYAVTEQYMLACDEIKETEISFAPPDEGNMYVSFRFRFENISDRTLYHFGYPLCYADGVEMPMMIMSGELFMPGEVAPYGSYEGYMCYEVPIDTEFFEITYQDKVRIIVENTLGD